ncbi:MAG: HEPN domain-containing protein [bacterium]
MKNVTLEWIKKAEQDFLVAEREYKEKPPAYDAVCFHAQQCIEKYMKAVLQENDVFFEKTHDLDLLLEQCKKFIPELSNYKRDLIDLSSFAVEVRYPGILATIDEAREAITIMEKIRTIIREYWKIS